MAFKYNSKYFNNQIYFKLLIIVILPFTLIYFVDGEPKIKDKSMVKYVNPKYMGNVEVIMFRRRNRDPSKSNITATFFHAWGPNVTILVSYPIQDEKMFNISIVGCKSIDKLWMVQLLRQNTNVTECPSPAGTYRYFNLGPVPRVFPSPVPSVPNGSSNTARIEVYMTSTKERIANMLLHVHAKK